MPNFNFNRTWGVEIEFKNSSNVDIQKVIREINAGGVMCAQEGYNHHDQYGYWKKVTDSSVSADNGGLGHELVSPPLKGEEGFRQLKVVCSVLNANGVKIDKTCGLHVHQDAHDLTIENFRKIFGIYLKFEGTFDSMMPESRRLSNNTYCDSIRRESRYGNSADITDKAQIQKMLDLIKGCASIQQISNLYSRDRYHKLNIESYVRHGTIEFRQHSGTIDYDKIFNWIVITNIIVEKSKESLILTKFKQDRDSLYDLARCLGLYEQSGADALSMSVRKFFNKRIEYLNKNKETEVAV